MRIYKAKTTLKWFKMLPNPTTRCWRMVLEMQTVCKPKPWQQLLLELKTLLAFCFHWHSLATTFFTGPIISIQIIKISSIVSWKGTYIKRRQYWVQTEVKLKLSIISVFLVKTQSSQRKIHIKQCFQSARHLNFFILLSETIPY